MASYWKCWCAYHKRYSRLYLLLVLTISLFYLLQWPTPISLMLKPLGLQVWSVGLTRALVRLLQGDFRGAWSYNPLIFLVVLLGLLHVGVAPLLEKKGGSDDTFTR